MKSIFLKIENYRNIPLGNPLEIEIMGGVTFILGLNNFGKSNLLRFLFELKPVFQVIINNPKGFNTSVAAPAFFDQIVNRKSDDQKITFKLAIDEYLLEVAVTPGGANPHTKTYTVMAADKTDKTEGGFNIASIEEELKSLADTFYIGAFRSTLFQTSGTNYDVEIGERFIKLWGQWASGGDIDHRKKMEYLTEELKELFGFSRFNIGVNDDRSNLLVSTDDGSFDLDELGGGISHFIIVLANVLIRNPGYILVDEPESGLHPKMQEVFVRALASKAKYGVIASSHSIGLARSSADKILSLTKSPEGRFKLEAFGQHYSPTISQSVNEMGYSQFMEVGGNNILLVEGRTDIKVFREILRKFKIETSFIILSLGGGEFLVQDASRIIEELGELKRLNAKSISVIFDSNKTRSRHSLEPALLSFKKSCKQLGFNVFPTEVHSTENYITQDAIDEILGPGFTALTPYQNFNDPSFNKWDKNKNWLLIRAMKNEDFRGTALEKFIEDKLVPNS